MDGTQIHGQNARRKYFTAPKLKRHLDRIDKRIEEVMTEFAALDAFEASAEKSEMRARTQDALDVLKARKANYDALQRQLADSKDKQVSLADPDAYPRRQAIVEPPSER